MLKIYKYFDRGLNYIMKVALQLYTVRDETKKDFLGTLEKVAEIGYDGVEFAGFGDIPAETMKAKLAETGLQVAGSHTPIDLLENELEEVINYNKIIANSNIVVPYHEFNNNNKEEYFKFAKKLETLGKELSKHDLTLFYHNHSHELEKFDGEYGLDILLANAGIDYLQAEIDTCWVYAAGLDPVEYIAKYAGRVSLLHIKDIVKGEFTEVGNGEINIQAIVDKAKEIGTDWLIVEQDSNQKPGIESARISYDNLSTML